MIYLIGGLGADERIFRHLKLGLPTKVIEWVKPHKNEPIQEYSKRLTDQIDPRQETTLIGVSFGGMIAQEIAKHVSCEKVIIISSVKRNDEFGSVLKFIRKTRIDRVIPSFLLTTLPQSLANFLFSISSAQESEMLRNIIQQTDPDFLLWSIDQILGWQPQAIPNILHIHGDSDRIFPIKNIHSPIIIKDGGHFMIVDKVHSVRKQLLNLL